MEKEFIGSIVYQHKYDPRMTVIQSYPWFERGLLLNEDKLVIAFVNMEDITTSANWILIEENEEENTTDSKND
jgi:hypothetical protein